MAETHLFQQVAAFVVAFWWTKQWLVTRPVSRWRFAMSAFAGAILWVYVAFTALGSVATSSGVTILVTAEAQAYLAGFMAFVSLLGAVLGLLLWTEEEGEAAAQSLPSSIQQELGD